VPSNRSKHREVIARAWQRHLLSLLTFHRLASTRLVLHAANMYLLLFNASAV
jgi:hypothetical protein